MKNSVLELQHVNLHFSAMEKAIVSDICYEVHAGDFVVVLGSNGSGKSSLLKLIDQRYQATSGKILMDGKSINHFSAKEFSRNVKTLTQNCHESLFTSLTVIENFILVRQQYEPHLLSVSHKNERDHFSKYILQFNPGLVTKADQIVEQLSGGEKQALALALIVLYPPRVLLLDEHTSALDPKSADSIMKLTKKIVEKYQITCMLATHDLTEAQTYGNRILAMRNGKIYQAIEGEEKTGLTQHELLAACY